jgi:hypothetical protein
MTESPRTRPSLLICLRDPQDERAWAEFRRSTRRWSTAWRVRRGSRTPTPRPHLRGHTDLRMGWASPRRRGPVSRPSRPPVRRWSGARGAVRTRCGTAGPGHRHRRTAPGHGPRGKQPRSARPRSEGRLIQDQAHRERPRGLDFGDYALVFGVALQHGARVVILNDLRLLLGRVRVDRLPARDRVVVGSIKRAGGDRGDGLVPERVGDVGGPLRLELPDVDNPPKFSVQPRSGAPDTRHEPSFFAMLSRPSMESTTVRNPLVITGLAQTRLPTRPTSIGCANARQSNPATML